MTVPTQKQVRMMHLVNLMSIAYADGNITENESDLIQRIAQNLELTEEEFNDCFEYWKKTDEAEIPIAVPDNEDEEVEFMKHFTLLMMIDGEINENEQQFLCHVADQFGYDPDKVVPMLIDDVYNEYFAENNQDEQEEEEEEDPLFEDTYDESQTSLGKMELESKRIEEAFDELFLPALRTPEAFEYFQIIPGIDTRLFRLTPKQLEKVQEVADKGYALGQYVLGRYHQVVKPDEDSIDKAQELLESALKGGIPDASWAMAMRYLYGYHGPVTFEDFNELIEQAIQNNSCMALKQRLHDMVYGEHGVKAEPKNVINLINNFLKQDESNAAKHPYLYAIMGDAYRKTGNKAKADECYEKAEDLGYFEAGADRFLNKIEGPDKDFYRDTLAIFLDSACDNQDPNAFLTQALEDVYHYDKQEGEKQQKTAQKLREHLETAYKLGAADAAYYIGKFYYTGNYGFEQNNQEAWNWFIKGQDRESGLAFAGTAEMVSDGIMPSNLPENYLEFCQLSALRRGVTEMLPAVIKAYKDGKFDSIAEEIEKNYLPMLNQTTVQAEIPTVVIVSPDGKATVYKVEKPEWAKLPHLIGAKRLAPLRVDALDQLGKKAGLSDRLVAWVDNDAPRKGLPVNPVAAKFYQGVIAGDIVFSLVDNLFDPVMFYGIDEAKSVVKALGVDLKEVVTDISKVSGERQKPMDYSKVNPNAGKGYVARIESDGKAHIINSSLGVFALFEEDIYDPMRLQCLYDLGAKLGLKGRLTLWTDNSALKKQLNWSPSITPNPVGAKWFPGPVADNLFVALEDENYRMTLFDDLDQLKKVCIALGVIVNNIIVD